MSSNTSIGRGPGAGGNENHDGDPTKKTLGETVGQERPSGNDILDDAALDVPARPKEIIVTTGATQAFDLLCRALLDPGDVVLVERPTYVLALQQLALAT